MNRAADRMTIARPLPLFLGAFILCLALGGCHHAVSGYARHTDTLPHDVHVFISHSDSCAYYRTQAPFAFDDERPSFVSDQIAHYCTTAAAERAQLTKKYASRADVVAAINAGAVE